MKVRSDSVCLFTRHSNLTFNLRGALRADNKCDPQNPASSGPAVATRGGLVAEISSAECCHWTLHWPLPPAISFARYRVWAKWSTKIQHKIIGWWPPPTQLVSCTHYCGELTYEHYQSESPVASVHCPGHLTILTSHTGTAGCWPHCSSPRPSHKMFMAMWSIGQMSDEDNLEASRIGAKWREMNCHGILITIYSRITCRPFMFSTNSSTLWSLCLWDFDSFNWKCSYHPWF